MSLALGAGLRLLGQLLPAACGAAAAVPHRLLSSAAGSQEGLAIVHLDDVRSVIKLEGHDLQHFLQKVITNDATQLAPGAPPMYACVLSPQGRYLHDMFLHALPDTDRPTVLVDCDAQQRRALMDLLQKYSLHHKIDVTSASKHYTVCAAFGGGITGTAAAPERAWPADPRLPALGRRAVVARGSAPVATATWGDYQRWRITQGVPEGDTEIPSGEAVPLEYCLDRLNGISFTKGCYVGQEFVARVHALGVVRKRIMPFRVGDARGAGCLSAVPMEAGRSLVFDTFDAEESLTPVGKVRALAGKVGLATLRVKEAMAAVRQGYPLLVGDRETGTGYAEVWLQRPEWWAPSWGYEDGFEEEAQRRAA